VQPVVFNANLEEALNLIGTFVFAMSGALLAVHKRYDIVGMTVLAEITAIGGGVVRDLILGAVPPSAFTDHITFLLPIGAVALVFVAYRYVVHGRTQFGPTLVLRYRRTPDRGAHLRRGGTGGVLRGGHGESARLPPLPVRGITSYVAACRSGAPISRRYVRISPYDCAIPVS